MMKRVLLIADSLGLPRKDIPYEYTWGYKIQQLFKDIEIVQRFQRALTTEMLSGSVKEDYLEYYSPDLVVLQVGIVDCSPRLFKKGSIISKVLNTLPALLSKPLWSIVKKYRQRSGKFADVSPQKFYSNIVSYCDRCQQIKVKQLVIIKIALPVEPMLSKSPEITEQVHIYNALFEKAQENYSFVTVIDPLGKGESKNFALDGYHISNEGADLVSSAILSTVYFLIK